MINTGGKPKQIHVGAHTHTRTHTHTHTHTHACTHAHTHTHTHTHKHARTHVRTHARTHARTHTHTHTHTHARTHARTHTRQRQRKQQFPSIRWRPKIHAEIIKWRRLFPDTSFDLMTSPIIASSLGMAVSLVKIATRSVGVHVVFTCVAAIIDDISPGEYDAARYL